MRALAFLKALARDACGNLLAKSGATAPGNRLQHSLSILTFHRVLTDSERRGYLLPGLAVTPQELDGYLSFAARHFQCMRLSDALETLAGGDVVPRPLMAITFDDGQADNYVHAFPALERHGLKATFYIPSRVLDDPSPLWHDALAELIGQLAAHQSARGCEYGPAAELLSELQGAPARPDAMNVGAHIETALEATKSWLPTERRNWIKRAVEIVSQVQPAAYGGFMSLGQMKRLLAHGHEVGSHSHSHPLLPQCTSDELQEEIAGSKRRLERALDTPVTSFCYPNGSTDRRSIDQVREAGYQNAVTTSWGANRFGSDRFQLRRFDMNARHTQDRNGRFSEARLAWRMSGLYPGLDFSGQNAYAGATE